MHRLVAGVPVLIVLTAAFALGAAHIARADGETAVPVQAPLTAAGYTVSVSSQLDATCTIWYVAGHGLTEYINDCDPNAAATVASLDDPNLIYERDWQLNHPDQLSAASAIAALCYSISRSAPMTDSFTIVGGSTDVQIPGAGLPALAASLPSVCGQGGPPPVVSLVPSTDGQTITVPGDPTIVAAITVIAVQLAISGLPPDQAYQAATQQLQDESTQLGLTEDQTVAFNEEYDADEMIARPQQLAIDLRDFNQQIANGTAPISPPAGD